MGAAQPCDFFSAPTLPGIFVLFDGLGLVAKRLEHVANSDPPTVRIISDNPLYAPYEGSAEEVNIVGRIPLGREGGVRRKRSTSIAGARSR